MKKLLFISLLSVATPLLAEEEITESPEQKTEAPAEQTNLIEQQETVEFTQAEMTEQPQTAQPKKPRRANKATRPTNRPESNTNQPADEDPGIDAQLILGKVQQMVNGVFNIAKDPHNAATIESSVAGIFGGLAAIASHASQRNIFKNTPANLNNFFENLSGDFRKQLLAYAVKHAKEFQDELMPE